MSKTSRKAKHSEKMKRKRAVKAARRTKYAALAGTSKRAKRQHQRKESSGKKHTHAMGNCGNIGCQRCFFRGKARVA